MTSLEDTDIMSETDRNWQNDTGWTDWLWNLQNAHKQDPLSSDCLPARAKDSCGNDGSNEYKETEDSSQAMWSEEQRLVYKMKQRGSIPLAYFGPLFHKDYNEFSIRIFPVTYQDVCESGLSRVVSLATSFRLHLNQQDNLLELYATEDKAKSIMEEILFAKFQCSTVSVEVERHEPDWEDTDDDGKPVHYPTVANKASFRWNSAYAIQHLKGTQLVDNTSDEKQKSLFLRNLPGKVDTLILRVLFPLCLKCTLLQVSSTAKAAILLMQSSKTAFHHVSSITDFCVDDKTVEMVTSQSSQQEAHKRTAFDKQGTATEQKQPSLRSSEGPANKQFGFSGLQNTPVQVSADKIFTQKRVDLPGARNSIEKPKPKQKFKSPSDIRRDNARRLKFEQQYKILSLSPPPIPSELRSLSASSRGNSFASSSYPSVWNSQETSETKGPTAKPASHQPAAIHQPTYLSEVKHRKPQLPPYHLTWQCRPWDRQQELKSSRCSGYHHSHVTSADDNSQYLPEYQNRSSHRQLPVNLDYESSRPQVSRDYELPQPSDSKNYDLAQPSDRMDCELLLPADSKHYELPPPPHNRDVPSQPLTNRGYELERAYWDRAFEEHVRQDRDDEYERKLRIREYELEQTRRELEYLDRTREEENLRYYYGY